MDSKRLKLLILLPLVFSFCLKAKRSPFDVSKPSAATTGLLAAAASRTTSSSSTSTQSPSSSYTGSRTFTSLVPGEPFTFDPKITGQITNISISPSADTLPPGITFDSTTGIISGTPIAQSTAFLLTTFTITATGPNGSIPVTFDISVLASGDNVWTKIAGVAGSDTKGTKGSLMYEPGSGYLYMSGTTSGGGNLDGEVNPAAAGWGAAFITSYEINGNRRWTRVFGMSGQTNTDSYGIGFDSSTSKNIYISGTANGGSAGGTLYGNAISAGVYFTYVSKYDVDGNRQWTSVKIAGNNNALAIAVDSSGNSFITGTLHAAGIDSQTNTGWTDNAMYLFKYDTSGVAQTTSTRLLSATVGTGRDINSSSMTIDNSGNKIIVATSYASTRCGSGNTNGMVAVIKYDSSLAYQWCQGLGSSAYDSNPTGVTTDASGNIYATGYTQGNFGGQTLTGTRDMFITKHDSSGALQWVRLLGVASQTTEGNAIKIDSGSIYVTGSTTGNLDGKTKTGVKDMFIVKYNTSGTRIWTTLLGSSGSSAEGQGVAFDSAGTMYIAGSINGNIGGQTNAAAPSNALMITRFVK